MDTRFEYFLFVVYFLFYFHVCEAVENNEILYSTDSMGPRAWSDWTITTELGRNKNGWYLVRGVDPGSEAYHTCDVDIFNAFNWLQMPPLDIKQGKMIHIDIKFSMVNCTQKENSKSTCKNSLGVYYLEESEGVTQTQVKAPYSSFQRLGELQANGMFTSPTQGAKEIIKFKRFWFTKKHTSTRFVTIAFRDEGTCATIHHVEAHYFVCPERVYSLSAFKQTSAGSHFTEVQGECVDNAAAAFRPLMDCGSTGEWTEDNLVTDCTCNAGYQPDPLRHSCIECKVGYFKPNAGEGTCQLCPLHSSSVRGQGGGRSRCVCDPDHYRAPHDSDSMPCARQPSKPREMNVTVSGTDVRLVWKPPLDMGGRQEVWYQLVCEQCTSRVQYSPSPERITGFGINLHQLDPSSEYKLKLFAMSPVTSLTHAAHSNVLLRTGAKTTIEGLTAEWIVDSGVVLVSWQPPQIPFYQLTEDGTNNGRVRQQSLSYELHVWRMEAIYAIFNTNLNYHNLRDLSPGSYTFQVLLHSDPSIMSAYRTFVVTPKDVFMSGITPRQLGLTVALITAVSLLLLVVLLVAVWCYKRHNYACGSSAAASWSDHTKLMDFSPHEANLKLPCGQAFVDPGYYDDISQLLTEFTRELQVSQIEFLEETEEKVGPGLPDVVNGVIHYSDYEEPPVMIKKIRENASLTECKCFAMEAAIAGQFNHPNVLMLHGVALTGSEMYMCLEYTAQGPLDRILRDDSSLHGPLQLVHLLRGISCGMHYLSDLGYVHKVLNAENILVSNSSLCKIAGFDTRVALEYEESINASSLFQALIPWASVEVATFRKYSTASDVWSFGVLAWEVVSRGERPFWNWSPEEVLNTVEGGYRLPPPSGCPQVLYDLMTKCWTQERNQRPLFCQIREDLEQWIRRPASLDQLAYAKNVAATTHKNSTMTMGGCSSFGGSTTLTNSTHNNTNNTTMTVTCGGSATTYRSMHVGEWLKTLKLEQYAVPFARADFLTLEDVLTLDSRMLEALGVASGRHRKKILAAIDLLRGSSAYANIKHLSMVQEPPMPVLI